MMLTQALIAEFVLVPVRPFRFCRQQVMAISRAARAGEAIGTTTRMTTVIRETFIAHPSKGPQGYRSRGKTRGIPGYYNGVSRIGGYPRRLPNNPPTGFNTYPPESPARIGRLT